MTVVQMTVRTMTMRKVKKLFNMTSIEFLCATVCYLLGQACCMWLCDLIQITMLTMR